MSGYMQEVERLLVGLENATINKHWDEAIEYRAALLVHIERRQVAAQKGGA